MTFPDPADLNVEPEDAPPQDAPLVQQVVLTFSERPDRDRIDAEAIQIRDSQDAPARGTYRIVGRSVVFTPTLPLRPVTTISSAQFDTGGAGLEPATEYALRVGPTTFPFIANVGRELLSDFRDPEHPHGILVRFRTTADPTRFHGGLAPMTPLFVAADPADGTAGVSPGLFTDPDHLFAPNRPFFLRFDRPVDPATTNLGAVFFQLIDLDDRTAAFPAGIPLGLDVSLVENELDHALAQVSASGILPFGHALALEYPSDLRGLGQSGAPAGPPIVASVFTIASAPDETIHDTASEDFDTNAREESDPAQQSAGTIAAEWNRSDSRVLTAGFGFQGSGELGRFVPYAPAPGQTRILTLDTSSQTFPLVDGSTPDAPPGLVITGGVFAFTDVDIPMGVEIRTIGPNPLVLTATGSFHLAGSIVANGRDGSADYDSNSSYDSVPGGPGGSGGGRGGVGHPIVFYPADQIDVLNLVSPFTGENGQGVDPVDGVLKPIGGAGGSCGIRDGKDAQGNYQTDQEIDCNTPGPYSNGSKGAGGGGGSLHEKGNAGIDGIGNVGPDGTGHWIVTDDSSSSPPLPGGIGGPSPFPDDGNDQNDFIGRLGQVTRWIGGQGGGGGGSRTDAYYCGIWCKIDPDPLDDGCCMGGQFNDGNGQPQYGDSVGDARGGGGGGGGGAVIVQALGAISLDSTASIIATGGNGAGGEQVGCSNAGGSGGGGSGGTVILDSGTSIDVAIGALLDLRPGKGDLAARHTNFFDCDKGAGHRGSGGDGGLGILELQVPLGSTANVVDPSDSIPPDSSGRSPWVDPQNVLNPTDITSLSVALSKWYDFGRVIERPPLGTNPVLAFGGLDSQGYVQTDSAGNVLDPAHTDIACDYLGQLDPITRQYKSGQEPRADFVPPNARIRVEFQGAKAIVEGSKEIDPASVTTWSVTPAIANGMQFLRWRITFDIATDGSALGPELPRPTVQRIDVHAQF